MVETETLDAALELVNASLGGKFKIGLVGHEKFDFLEVNAHFMDNPMFENLKKNIKKDGQLSSVPFCHKKGERYHVLSGNHRLKAGHDAGVEKFLVLYTDQEITKSEELSIQLSHNSLVGKDDVQILKDLYGQIEDIEAKYYAGLDDKTLDMIEKANLQALSEVAIDYRAIAMVFLPEEAEKMAESFENAKKEVLAKELYIGALPEYQRMMNALEEVQDSYHIKNFATSMMLILELFERNKTQLAEGWEKDVIDENTKKEVPISSVFGTDRINQYTAQQLQKARKKLSKDGVPATINQVLSQLIENIDY